MYNSIVHSTGAIYHCYAAWSSWVREPRFAVLSHIRPMTHEMDSSGNTSQKGVVKRAYSVNCSAERLADSVSDSCELNKSEKLSASVRAPSSLPSPVLHPVLPRPSRPCSCIRRCREALISSDSVLAELEGVLCGWDITGPLSRMESKNDFGDPTLDGIFVSAAGGLPETRLVRPACTCCRLASRPRSAAAELDWPAASGELASHTSARVRAELEVPAGAVVCSSRASGSCERSCKQYCTS